VVVPKLFDETLRKMGGLNLLFAASSLGLLLTTVWMVYDDYSRGWKGYQKEFQRLQAEKTRAQIEAAQKAVDAQTLESLEKQRAEARAAAEQHARDLEAARKKLREIEAVAYRDDLGYRTIKSTFDARKFDYEEAAHQGSPRAPRIEKEMDDLSRQLEDLRVKGLLHDRERTEAQSAIDQIEGRIAEADKKIADLEAGVDRLKKKLDKVAPSGFMKVALGVLNAPLLDFVAPSLKIQQVVLDRVPLDINFARVPRADRCQTCHLAADQAGFEDSPEPFRTHPKLNFFLGGASPHPVDRFGCTPCHRGRDRAVDFLYAVHQPGSEEETSAWEKKYGWKHDHYWEQPMLALPRTEAACLKCHQGVVRVPEAEHLNRALEIVGRYGCYGCHKMRGFENRPKVAPPLTRPTAKLTPEWMGRWIKNPKAFRPSTRMPRFFGLQNNQGPGDAEREDAEITGIVAYLTEKAEKVSYPPLPGRGDAERGRHLVKSIGCMGCHAIEKDEVQPDVLKARNTGQAADPLPWERRFGPDLSRIGSKAKPEWIYQWILNPRQYNPETRMPSLRLSAQEALDITAYLTTLVDDTMPAERVAPVAPRPQARDRALLAYLSQRMPPQDTQAKLQAMSDHERDVMLGERTISRYGCFGCHLVPGFEKTPPIGTDLSEEGSKPADLLLFGFVSIEHTAPAWFFQKLKDPRSFDGGHVAEFYDRLRMPQFGFTDEQADAVTLLLQGLTKEKMPLESMRRMSARDEAVEAGRRLVRDYNCQGCHILEGRGGAIRESIAKNLMAKGMSEEEATSAAASFSPPILEGEGDKVQPDWLFGFLKGPTPIRPWLEVRMPTFQFTDAEADTLVHHFAAREQRIFPFQTLPQAPPTGPGLQAALKMFGPDYFNCWNCHQQGARKPPGPPEGWAPDLTLASRRLNADWIERWLSNPQKLMPGTKMPTFYDPEDPKGSAPPDVLEGDPQRQIRALSEYVFTLGLKRGGTSAGAAP
jgi:cbb3-type cytochrome oxidase cytochrome c subunit